MKVIWRIRLEVARHIQLGLFRIELESIGLHPVQDVMFRTPCERSCNVDHHSGRLAKVVYLRVVSVSLLP